MAEPAPNPIPPAKACNIRRGNSVRNRTSQTSRSPQAALPTPHKDLSHPGSGRSSASPQEKSKTHRPDRLAESRKLLLLPVAVDDNLRLLRRRRCLRARRDPVPRLLLRLLLLLLLLRGRGRLVRLLLASVALRLLVRVGRCTWARSRRPGGVLRTFRQRQDGSLAGGAGLCSTGASRCSNKRTDCG